MMWLAESVQWKTMTQWDLHLVLGSLLWLPLASVGNRPTCQLDLNGGRSKCASYLPWLQRGEDRLFTHSVWLRHTSHSRYCGWPIHCDFAYWAGFLAKNQLPVRSRYGSQYMDQEFHTSSLMTVRECYVQYISFNSTWMISGSFGSLPTLEPCLPWYLPEPHLLQVDYRGGWNGFQFSDQKIPVSHCRQTEIWHLHWHLLVSWCEKMCCW